MPQTTGSATHRLLSSAYKRDEAGPSGWRKRSVATAACLLALNAAPYAAAQQAADTANANGAKSAGQARAAQNALSGLQDAFAEVAERVEPAVVTVFSVKTVHPSSGRGGDKSGSGFVIPPHRVTGTGSGVIISKDGWVLTNDHVVGGADHVTIKLHDGREFAGAVRRDRRSDLALVKIESAVPLPVAALGDSDKIKIGHWAIAIGSPYRYEGSFSVGVISSLARQQKIADAAISSRSRVYSNMIQTDAAINPGNSGGPLCNLSGEVIGINTAIESEGGGSIGIGFSIPINTARFVAAQLRDKGHVEYGYLGVSLTSVTPNTAAALNVSYGALLDAEPPADSPAGRAGLHAGDVVTGVDGKAVRTESDLRLAVGQTIPGTTVDLAVMREGQPRLLKATLERAEDDREDAPRAAYPSRLGIEVQALASKGSLAVGPPADTHGVLVKSVDAETAAGDTRDAGRDDVIEPGDIIIRVNGKDTPSVQAFHEAVGSVKSGSQITVVFLQAGREFLKRFTIVRVE